MLRRLSKGWRIARDCVTDDQIMLLCAAWLVYFVWWRNLSLPPIPASIFDQMAGLATYTWEDEMTEQENIRLKWGLLVLLGFLGLFATTIWVRPWLRSPQNDGTRQLPELRESAPASDEGSLGLDEEKPDP